VPFGAVGIRGGESAGAESQHIHSTNRQRSHWSGDGVVSKRTNSRTSLWTYVAGCGLGCGRRCDGQGRQIKNKDNTGNGKHGHFRTCGMRRHFAWLTESLFFALDRAASRRPQPPTPLIRNMIEIPLWSAKNVGSFGLLFGLSVFNEVGGEKASVNAFFVNHVMDVWIGKNRRGTQASPHFFHWCLSRPL